MSYLQRAFEKDTLKKLTNGQPTDFSWSLWGIGLQYVKSEQ